jgi:gliding motility-related protein
VIVQQAPMMGGMVFTEKFNEMLEKAHIGPELFMKIGAGLERLSDASNGIAKISAAVSATEKMSENMERAGEALGKFAGSYEESGAILSRKAKVLADAFEKTSAEVADTGMAFSANFKDIVQQAANKLSNASNNVDKGVTEAGVQLATMNKNLAALNAAHDVQLQNIQARLKANDEVNKKVEEMLRQMLEKATEDTSRYSKSVSQLADNVSRLNSVYGNMLSAMGTLANR